MFQERLNERLFRPEALSHASHRRYGNILLSSPISHWVLVYLLLAISLCVIVFLATFSYQKRIRVNGTLLPDSGLIRIVALQGGSVVKVLVNEGQSVKSGQILFMLQTDHESVAKGNAALNATDLIQKRLESYAFDRSQVRVQLAQRVSTAIKRSETLSADIIRVESQIILQRERVEIAAANYRQQVDLQDQGFVAPSQVMTKKADLIDQRQRLGDLERIKAAASRELSDVQASMIDARIQTGRELSTMARDASSLEQDLTENEARRETVIRAPMDGIVSSIDTAIGQSIGAGSAIAVLLPRDSQLRAELLISARDIGFVKSGMSVMLRYEAFPFQQFGQFKGEIFEVSNSTVIDSTKQNDGSKVTVPVYRVRASLPAQTVRAFGKDVLLKPGMVVDASVLTETRKLYEWAFEPLYTVVGRHQ